jgi:hypothetical protein
MGPLYLILLVLSICANVSVRLLGTSGSTMLNIFGGLVMVLFFVGIMAVCIVTLVLMINRFRTNLLGDEGYVMFTLPASVHQQVWSKIIVSTVWSIASGAAVFLAAGITVFRVDYVNDFFRWLEMIFRQITSYYAINGAAFALEALALLLISCAAFCLQFYAAMAVGHSFVGHKSLLSVVFFFVFQFALQFLGLSGAFSFEGFNFGGAAAIHAALWIMIASCAAVGVIFYLITTFMLKRHLNLE